MCYFAFHLLTSVQSRRHDSDFFKYAVKSVAVQHAGTNDWPHLPECGVKMSHGTAMAII